MNQSSEKVDIGCSFENDCLTPPMKCVSKDHLAHIKQMNEYIIGPQLKQYVSPILNTAIYLLRAILQNGFQRIQVLKSLGKP
jgi:hypothetical protein